MGLFWSSPENSTLNSVQPWKKRRRYRCSFEFYPIFKGRRLYCFKGIAVHGTNYQTLRKVVVKTVKGLNNDGSDIKHYVASAEKAKEMAGAFSNLLSKENLKGYIEFNKPALAFLDEKSELIMFFTRIIKTFDKRFTKGELVVFEDFLQGEFKTFISERGIRGPEETDIILAAFCHFSYYHSNGELVVCNLQGICDGGTYFFTNPVIHSRNREFGIMDHGQDGIETVFRHHKCNYLCARWACISYQGHPLTPTAPPPPYDKAIRGSDKVR